MPGADKELQIKIATTADLAGAKEATRAIEEVGKATNSTAASNRNAASASDVVSAANKQAAKSANELGENFERGAAAGRVLTEVARGNFLALGRLGTAIKTIGTLMKTNLIGTLFTLGAVAANLILPMIQGFNSAKEKAEDAAKAAKKLGDARLDSLKRELESVRDGAEEAKKEFERAQAAKERLDNVEQAEELALIRADKSLSEEQRTVKESETREKYRKIEEQRVRERLEAAVADATRRFQGAQAAAESPTRVLQQSVQNQNELERRTRERAAAREELGELRRQEIIRDNLAAEGAPVEDTPEIIAGRQRRVELEKVLGSGRDVSAEELKAAAEAVEAALKTANEAQARVGEAAAARREAQATLESELAVQEKIAPKIENTRRAELRVALPQAQQRDSQTAEQRKETRGRLTELQGEFDQAALANDGNRQNEIGVEMAKLAAKLKETETSSAANIAAAATAISAAAEATPQPLDPKPLSEGFIVYNDKVLTLFNGQVVAIQTVAEVVAAQAKKVDGKLAEQDRQIARLNQQLANSRQPK